MEIHQPKQLRLFFKLAYRKFIQNYNKNEQIKLSNYFLLDNYDYQNRYLHCFICSYLCANFNFYLAMLLGPPRIVVIGFFLTFFFLMVLKFALIQSFLRHFLFLNPPNFIFICDSDCQRKARPKIKISTSAKTEEVCIMTEKIFLPLPSQTIMVAYFE